MIKGPGDGGGIPMQSPLGQQNAMDILVYTRSLSQDYTWQFSPPQSAEIEKHAKQLIRYISNEGQGIAVLYQDNAFHVYLAGLTRLGDSEVPLDIRDRQIRVGIVVSHVNQETVKGLVRYFLENWDNPGNAFGGIVKWNRDEWHAEFPQIADIITKQPRGRTCGAAFPKKIFGPSDAPLRGLVNGHLAYMYDFDETNGVKLVVDASSVPEDNAGEIKEHAVVYLNDGNGFVIEPNQPEKVSGASRIWRGWPFGFSGVFWLFFAAVTVSLGLNFYQYNQNDELHAEINRAKVDSEKSIGKLKADCDAKSNITAREIKTHKGTIKRLHDEKDTLNEANKALQNENTALTTKNSALEKEIVDLKQKSRNSQTLHQGQTKTEVE